MKDIVGRKIKVMHLAAGLDLIGSKSTIHHKNVEMTAVGHGIHCLAKINNREVVIPFDNIKGYELLPEEPKEAKVKKA